jgi:hypothetical protein
MDNATSAKLEWLDTSSIQSRYHILLCQHMRLTAYQIPFGGEDASMLSSGSSSYLLANDLTTTV